MFSTAECNNYHCFGWGVKVHLMSGLESPYMDNSINEAHSAWHHNYVWIKSEQPLAHFGLQGGGGSVTTAPPEFDNCIPLHETLQLSWRVDTDNSQVRFRLCGCLSLDAGSVHPQFVK